MGSIPHGTGGRSIKTLYITDLDGTLLNNNARLSETSAEILNRLLEKGLLFSVATARSVVTVAPILQQLPMTLPAVLMNGVYLSTLNCDFVRFERYRPDTAERVIKAFEENGRPPFVFSVVDNEIGVEYRQLQNEADREFHNDRVERYKSFVKVDAFRVTDDVIYVNAVDNEEVIRPVYEAVMTIDGVTAVMYKDVYTDYWFLECFSSAASKINGALFLKQLTGADRIVAFGDNLNDKALLEGADVAVAVANAKEEIKKIADFVIDSNEDNGVARFIEKDFHSKP